MKQLKVKSFLCEHTTEFALVPRMVKLLTRCFPASIPMAYWKRREGNSLAAMRHRGIPVRLIAMFPRRPKLAPRQDEIFGKINKELFDFAALSQDFGVPSVAGFPIVSSLWEFSNETPVIWLSLGGAISSDLEFAVHPSTHECRIVSGVTCHAITATDDEVLSLATHQTRCMDWSDAIEAIDVLRRNSSTERSRRGLFGDQGYKPIYFVIREA